MTIEQHSDEAKTGWANSVRAPTWDIQRRLDRLFTDLYGKRMVGKHSLFCEDPGRQIHDPFLLAISRGHFCEPRFVKNSRTVKRRPHIVRNVAHKSSATWERCVACGAGHETVLYCVINTDGPRMTMDLPSCARPKLSLSAFQ